MTFTSWAATLNGVTVSSACEEHTPDVNCEVQNENLLIDALSAPPDGLGLPGLRTEDVTYYQRDGVRHFSDWYQPRVITLVGTIGPEVDCEACTSTREQLAALIKAWRRSCCDIELVIHTPCDGDFIIGDPVLGPQTIRRNLIRNPSFEEDLTFWTVPADSFCRTYDRCYTGGGWCYANAVDGAWTESRETDGGWVGDAYMRLTNDVPPTQPGMGFTYQPPSEVTEIEVAAGEQYTTSAYLRASDTKDVVAQILWYDPVGTLLSVTTGETDGVGTDWLRVHLTATAPENADHAYTQWVTLDPAQWTAGDTLDIDGALFEAGEDLLDYFDGDTPDVEAPTTPAVGDRIETNLWVGNPHASESVQSSQTYVENLDRSLFGPVGIVGRPRVATYDWVSRKEQIAQFTLRFDATDHLMYLLDECGTPGYQECVDVQPGLTQTCRTYDLCYPEGGRCYNNESAISLVMPVIATLRGTERINPLIVLYPGLSYPVVENMSQSEFIRFDGIVDVEPIQIDTKNGVATGVNSGASYTHLLGGSIFMSMVPGENQVRMYSNASEDTGYAAICYRPAVVSI
jgi:hypothetical protein